MSRGVSVKYRVLIRCFVDGALRDPGVVFRARRFEPCPAHLQELDDDPAGEGAAEPAKKNGPKAKRDKASAGVTAADMGVINGPDVPPTPEGSDEGSDGESDDALDLTGLEPGAADGKPD
jgi:hypothetical protein